MMKREVLVMTEIMRIHPEVMTTMLRFVGLWHPSWKLGFGDISHDNDVKVTEIMEVPEDDLVVSLPLVMGIRG